MKRGSLEWIDSMNRAADSMADAMLNSSRNRRDKIDTIEFTSSIVEPLDTEYNWYSQAQNYVVPAFFVIILSLLIFGIITLTDSEKAKIDRKKVRLLDFLNEKNKN